jgi:hypothetical protein
MSESQLREAYILMKQGDKKAAAQLVQNVLREDKSNLNAWWLFANVLEDEEKVVKSLERVLSLNPDHAGARKKLASMRPEYAHLAESPAPIQRSKNLEDANRKTDEFAAPTKEKIKTDGSDEAYSNYLERKASRSKKDENNSDDWSKLWNNSGWGFKALIFAIPLIFVLAFIFFIQKHLSMPDKNGDTPQTVAERYYVALYKEDIDALYAMFCPERYDWLDEMISSFEGYSPDSVTVDTSDMDFELYSYVQEQNQAYVRIHGVLKANFAGSEFTMDMDEDAEAEGYDAYGMFFEKQDDIWLVCNPYAIYDLEYEDE